MLCTIFVWLPNTHIFNKVAIRKLWYIDIIIVWNIYTLHMFLDVTHHNAIIHDGFSSTTVDPKCYWQRHDFPCDYSLRFTFSPENKTRLKLLIKPRYIPTYARHNWSKVDENDFFKFLSSDPIMADHWYMVQANGGHQCPLTTEMRSPIRHL